MISKHDDRRAHVENCWAFLNELQGGKINVSQRQCQTEVLSHNTSQRQVKVFERSSGAFQSRCQHLRFRSHTREADHLKVPLLKRIKKRLRFGDKTTSLKPLWALEIGHNSL